jgi:hypothetical protein
MDNYRIGVSIALANGVSPVLAIIGRDLLGLAPTIKGIEKNFAGWATALGGVAAILGGSAMIGGLVALAKHGGDVNHQLELMKIAGMDNAEIQGSIAQAMKTTGNVMTTTLSENLAHIRELRYAFGDTTVAMSHLDEISKANSILNSVKGGGKDQVWELVKSLEQKGLTYKPEEFSSYVNTMTKVIEATGGKVTPEMFMSTFKYGRTSMLGWDESFVGGALPRLMQSMATGGGGGGAGSGGPGNALMSAFAKVVQGQMPKTAAEEFGRMGLAPGGVKHITGSSESQLPGGIAGRDQFMANPYEWVQKTLMPALAAHGITEQNDIISQISKMFPVRTASQIITEMGLQGRFHEGMNSPFEKDIALQKGAMGMAGGDELMKNDYPTVLREFNQQWENLLQTLGSPLMQPGGPVLTAMAGLTSTMNSISQFAAANPDAIKNMTYAIGALGAVLVGGGIAALGTLASIPAALTGIVLAVMALGYLEWDKVRGYLLAFNQSITDFINWLGGIADKIKNLFVSKGDKSNDDFVKGLKEGYMPMSFSPGQRAMVAAQPIALSLNVDGRTLAQAVSDQLMYLYEHPTRGPSGDGQGQFNPPANKFGA